MGCQLHAHWTDSQSTSGYTLLIARALLSVRNRQIVYHLMCHRADTTPFNLLGVSNSVRDFSHSATIRNGPGRLVQHQAVPLLGSWARKRKRRVPASPLLLRRRLGSHALCYWYLLSFWLEFGGDTTSNAGSTLNPHNARTVYPRCCKV